MSTTQTNNIELNNKRMEEIMKNVEHIFGYVLIYSVMIFTILSALLGGIFACPIYAAIYIFNKLEDKYLHLCTSKTPSKSADLSDKCNSFCESLHVLEKCEGVEDKSETDDEEQEQDKNPIIDDKWCNISVKNIINYQRKTEDEEEEDEEEEDEEILSLKIPEYTCSSKTESEKESEDNSPNDKYSLHYNQDQVDLHEN